MWIRSSYCDANGNCLETGFRRSSYCDSSACVEAAFRRSSFCDTNGCLEVAHRGQVLVRDSKQGEASPILSFSPVDWTRFLDNLPDRIRS